MYGKVVYTHTSKKENLSPHKWSQNSQNVYQWGNIK